MSPAEVLDAVETLVEERLYPAAADVDRGRRHFSEHLPALAELGLLAMVIDRSSGGLGLAPPQIRSVLRLLGSGCGVTAFAFAQHHGTMNAVATTANAELRARWLRPLATDTLAGIAYAHLRRPGPPPLRAVPDSPDGPGGSDSPDGSGGLETSAGGPETSAGGPERSAWRLYGSAPWVTSWGTAGAFMMAAMTEDDRMVWSLVPGRTAPGLPVAGEFELMVFQATDTVALDLDGYRVEPANVLRVIDADQWRGPDRLAAARPNPLCIGVGDRALAELAASDPATAAGLRPWWEDLVLRAEAQSSAVDRKEAVVAEVAAMRAETLAGVQRLTTALLAAAGGRAMERGHPAERLSREALFYVIQAQNDAGRAATLAAALAAANGGATAGP